MIFLRIFLRTTDLAQIVVESPEPEKFKLLGGQQRPTEARCRPLATLLFGCPDSYRDVAKAGNSFYLQIVF